MSSPNNKKFNYLLFVSFLVSVLLIAGATIYSAGLKTTKNSEISKKNQRYSFGDSLLEEKIAPFDGVELPVKWGKLGKEIIEAGVIDKEKFESLYAARGGLSDEEIKLLYAKENGNLVINPENAGFVLNLLWALGLGNKNEILEKGLMTNPQYGGAGVFASTGGWTIAKDDAMNHYSKHQFIVLTPEHQALVERVSKNIYRPCCNNPVYFPDCNHGMAMLGFLELAASQGASESQLYGMALVLNSYWFPDTYLTIAKYLENQGISWEKIDTKEILGADFSSASGYQKILAQVVPPENSGGGSCGV